MTDRSFEPGDTVLIRRPREEGGPASADVLTFKPTERGRELEITWHHSGKRDLVGIEVIERPCRRRFGCITLHDSCRHCGENRADPHMPGCPHSDAGGEGE